MVSFGQPRLACPPQAGWGYLFNLLILQYYFLIPGNIIARKEVQATAKETGSNYKHCLPNTNQ